MKLLLSIFFYAAASFLFGQSISDIIHPVRLIAGETDSILISDLFYAEDYQLRVRPTNNIETKFENNTLVLSPKSAFEGVELIPFSYKGQEFCIPILVEISQKINFKFQPINRNSSVNVFGSFNNWNRSSLKMMDENNDGIFELTIPLEPGSYEYKYFVIPPDTNSDGEEHVDPFNPVQLPNGFGGFNSVLTVQERHTGKFYLHNLEKNETDQLVSFLFYIEIGESAVPPANQNVFALLNNTAIEKSKIKLEGGKIFLTLRKDELAGQNVLRILVCQNGRTSNIQTIFLQEGETAGSNKKFLWHDAVLYSILIDRFKDGDNTNSLPVVHPELTAKANYMGGDLRGVINKLDEGYFTSLGINTLWLSPVIDNTENAYQEYPAPHRYYTGYHGYWPVHPAKVEERFGDMELLKELVKKAHAKNIKVLLDYVANHIHIEHPFWKAHREWFGTLDLPDGRKNLRLWDEQRLTTWFEPYMPSFDYEASDEALEVMTDNAVWWLKETGADGFRHDAVKHIPNKFWRILTQKVKKEFKDKRRENIFQIGETFGSYDLVSSYVNNGQLDAQFNFNLYDTALPVFIDSTASFKSLDEQMKKTLSTYGVNHLMGNVMDSHDKVRFMAFADGDIAAADGMNAGETGWTNPPEVDYSSSYDKLKLKMVYLLTIPGLPVVYYGDEFGMTGAADPDNRRMMKFGDELNAKEKETLDDVKKIIRMRSEHSSLRYGDFLPLQTDENIYAYIRSDMTERVVTVLNKSEKDVLMTLFVPAIYNLHKAADVISGEEYFINNNVLEIKLKPYSYQIFKVN